VPFPLRPELEPLPARLRHLPIASNGYPVPWFVAWVKDPAGGPDVPEFRAMDARKFGQAVKDRLCWVCGERLGRHLGFLLGPMCTITRTISEPPAHVDCCIWSARFCPFLSQPKMIRREGDVPPDVEQPSGFGIKRNPGVMAIWIAREYELFRPPGGGQHLITVGEPERVTWWREGRAATRAEIEESIASGLPALLSVAKLEGPFSVDALGKQVERAKRYLPPEEAAF
jgi:hypothetical protein